MVSPVNPDSNQTVTIFAAARDVYSQIPKQAAILVAHSDALILGRSVDDINLPAISNKVRALATCLQGDPNKKAMASQLMNYQVQLEKESEKRDVSAICTAASGLRRFCLELELTELPIEKQKLLESLIDYIENGVLLAGDGRRVSEEQQEEYLLHLFQQLKDGLQGSLLDLPVCSRNCSLQELFIDTFYPLRKPNYDFRVFKTLFQVEKLPPMAILIHGMAVATRFSSDRDKARDEFFYLLIKNNIDFAALVAADHGQEPLIIEITKVDRPKTNFRLEEGEWDMFFATGFDINVRAINCFVATFKVSYDNKIKVSYDNKSRELKYEQNNLLNPTLLEIFLSAHYNSLPNSSLHYDSFPNNSLPKAACAVDYGAQIDCWVTSGEQKHIREALRENPEVKSLPRIADSQIQLVKQLDRRIYRNACEAILGSPEGPTRKQVVQQAISGISTDGTEAASSARADGIEAAGIGVHMPSDLIDMMSGERGYENPRLEVAALVREMRAQEVKAKAKAKVESPEHSHDAGTTNADGTRGGAPAV